MRAGPISDNNLRVLFFIHHRNRRGFTLLELIVVLIIISLMSAVVVPRLVGPMGNLDLKTASQKISASLRYVRSHAASEKTTYEALFDFDNKRLIIARSATPRFEGDLAINDGKAYDRMPAEMPDDEKNESSGLKTYNLPDGIKFANAVSREGDINAGLFRVFFYPSGGSSGGEITVANERGGRYKINVDFITGAVQLSEVTG